MKKNMRFVAFYLSILSMCTAAPGWASNQISLDMMLNDLSAENIYLAQADVKPPADDLELGGEVEKYRERKPQGSYLESENDASELFGDGGYVHPFVSLAEGYSDNIFNENSGEDSDFSTTFSTGLWLAYPSSRTQLLALNTSSTTPGGLAQEREYSEYFKRYQTYLLYQADFVAYHDFNDANSNKHKVEGLFQYNLKGGLSLELVEEYKKSQDPYSTGFSTQLDKYQTNLFDTTLSYDFTKSMTGRLEYSHYWVDYDDVANEGRNRIDNKYSVNLSFDAMPKTTFTTEYRFVDVDYDKQIVSGSKMHYLFGGVNWAMSPKTSIKMKTGYVHKNFDDSSLDDVDDIVFDITGLTEYKTNSTIQLSGSRKISETNSPGIDYMLSHNLSMSLIHELTAKLSASLFLSYVRDKYNGEVTVGTVTQERKDDLYSFSPGLDYIVNDWFLCGLSYSYTERDSNFSSNEYENNSFMLRGTVSF